MTSHKFCTQCGGNSVSGHDSTCPTPELKLTPLTPEELTRVERQDEVDFWESECPPSS